MNKRDFLYAAIFTACMILVTQEWLLLLMAFLSVLILRRIQREAAREEQE